MLNNGVQGQWVTNKRHKRSGVVVGAEGWNLEGTQTQCGGTGELEVEDEAVRAKIGKETCNERRMLSY